MIHTGLVICKFLKFHERAISALNFELSCKRSQNLVVNSCERMKVFKFTNKKQNFKLCTDKFGG